MAYFGPTGRVIQYFASRGYTIPSHTNPSDFIMELVVDPADRAAAAVRRKALCESYDQVEQAPTFGDDPGKQGAGAVSARAGGDLNNEMHVLYS